MYRFFLPVWPQNSTSPPPSSAKPGTPGVANLVHNTPQTPDTPLKLPREEAKHAQRVLRLKIGDTLEIFDGQGHVAQAQLTGPDYGQIKILSQIHVPALNPAITIAAATPKGPRAEHMVDQLSQAGAHAWIPLRTHHAVVHPRDTKLDRLRRAAIESAKQCRRAHLLQVHDEQTVAHILHAATQTPDTLIAAANQDGQPLADHITKNVDAITLLVGPEGGWSDPELSLFDKHKIPRVTLGPHVMRIETAAIAAALIARVPSHESLENPTS